MRKIIKKITPKFILNMIIKIRQEKIITNYYGTNFSKTALLSHTLLPFKKNSYSHTSFLEAKSWTAILNQLGFNVDIVHYLRTSKVDVDKYDLICGFGNVFQQYFESNISKKIITIYYGTGMHVCHQNTATLNRVSDVYNKKNVWLGRSARFVSNTWTHQTCLIDGIIALGNEVCAQSYKKYYDGYVNAIPAPFYKVSDANYILNHKQQESRRNFLWFGSAGLIHKGLDLLLEYFSRHPELTLHVCGPIDNELDFVKSYYNELFATKNIINHGFIDIESNKFEVILRSCSFVVLPSCSEGGSPSVVTAVGNGALIPIVSKWSTFSTGYEININSLDDNGISEAISYAINLSNDELLCLANKNLEYVLRYHSQNNYTHSLKASIEDIIYNSVI